MVNLTYKLFEEEEAQAVASMLYKNFREVNSKDYSEEGIEKYCQSHTATHIIERAQKSHFYTFYLGEKLVGCGAIAPFHGSEEEAILLTIFVEPDYHGQGIGKNIIEVLENDSLFKIAKRIEIPASITAVEFYRKLGYNYKNEQKQIDSEGLYRLEKINN